jgi:hypothetical protein
MDVVIDIKPPPEEVPEVPKEEIKKNTVFEDGQSYYFECPNCGFFAEVDRSAVNCGIFRHAYYFTGIPDPPRFSTLPDPPKSYRYTEMVNPHTPKEICDTLSREGKVVGCCKPFRFTRDGDRWVVETCDYI